MLGIVGGIEDENILTVSHPKYDAIDHICASVTASVPGVLITCEGAAVK